LAGVTSSLGCLETAGEFPRAGDVSRSSPA
jgi:hypothetical protein